LAKPIKLSYFVLNFAEIGLFSVWRKSIDHCYHLMTNMWALCHRIKAILLS